jgi:hypothetical protein
MAARLPAVATAALRRPLPAAVSAAGSVPGDGAGPVAAARWRASAARRQARFARWAAVSIRRALARQREGAPAAVPPEQGLRPPVMAALAGGMAQPWAAPVD